MINKNNFSIDVFHAISNIFSSDNLDECRYENLKFAISQTPISGSVLEFGVHSGSTVNLISSILKNEIIYGFDSFEGLPEDWNISYNEKFNKHKKGYFAVDSLPEVDKNVRLVKGFFDQSLSPWIEEHHPEQIKFLHIDSDLYSSAIYVLKTLNSYIVPGTVIVFDEFYPWGRKRYDRWEEHEYRALKEWITEFDREFTILSRSSHQQCAIKMLK
jgi:hypothetical protein